MTIDENNVKRLVIYFLYDKEGIADDYVLYMLNALKQNNSEILLVCNGLLVEESRSKLEKIVDSIIVRENKGFDVWAYKTGIDSIGWDELETYDEMIMMNATIMGPVYPFEEMFSEMDKKDLDFWGVTKFHKYEEGDPFGTIEVGYIPEHIQSHFIAVRKSMISSKSFQDYWNNMGPINDYRDAVGKHEAMFTMRFEKQGFKWDVYADLEEDFNNHPILCAADEMLKKKRCPIFKRRSFMQSYDNILHDTVGQAAIEAYDFIKNHTDYDEDMIWQNILRLENMADIKKNMQLNYILSSNNSVISDEVVKEKKIALIIHAYFDDLLEYCYQYASNMPDNADVYVTVPNEKNKKDAEEIFGRLPNNVKVMVIENRGRDVSSFLVASKTFIMDYDFVCFMHDKKVGQISPKSIGYGFSYKCFENLLTTKEFVKNIINTFDNNPRLGMLMPPPPNHGDYYFTLGMEWGDNFDITKKLADELGLTIPFSKEKEPISPLGTMFWVRPQAMKRLFDVDWNYEDFPKEPNNFDGTLLHAIERIYGLVVQQEGYYPAWVFCDKGASMEITNLNYMIRSLNNTMFYEGIGAGNFEKVHNGLVDMCETHMSIGGKISGKQVEQIKIYLDAGRGFNESDSLLQCVKNRTCDKLKLEFENLSDFSIIYSIRIYPGELAGVTIKDIKVTIQYIDGKESIIKKRDMISNGIELNGKIVFLLGDPNMEFKLNRKNAIDKLIIEGEILSGVDYDELNTLFHRAIKVRDKVKVFSRKAKRKMRGIIKK